MPQRYDGAGVAGDVTPPAAVANLVAGGATTSSLSLSWTAPGDDGTTGTAAVYDARWSAAPITEANWGSATAVSNEPSPVGAGGLQNMALTGLPAGTMVYVALKTADEVPNWSTLSNVAAAATLARPTTRRRTPSPTWR